MSSKSSDFRRHEIRHAAQVLADALVPKIDAMCRNCANCLHSDVSKNLCTKYNETPPMVVVVKGCDSWEDDIPF